MMNIAQSVRWGFYYKFSVELEGVIEEKDKLYCARCLATNQDDRPAATIKNMHSRDVE